MPTLRLVESTAGPESHGDEVLACAYTPDNRRVVSGGWDGKLRVWDARSGGHLNEVPVSKKPVSACAVSPDGRRLVTGTLDGMLAYFEAETLRAGVTYLAHSRPISGITYTVDGRTLVTASWDRNVTLWNQRQESRPLTGHADSVAGCQAAADGNWLLTWSNDQSVRLWDLAKFKETTTLLGHEDRVLSGAISPDSRWAVSGGRDLQVKLWDLKERAEHASVQMESEVRFCAFLLDGQTLIAGDVSGKLALFAVPDLTELAAVQMPQPILCGALAPSGAQVALGCGDGRVHLIEVEGFDSAPLLVAVTQSTRLTATALQRLFGRKREVATFLGTCPVCRSAFELPGTDPSVQAPCPQCRRQLRVSSILATAEQ